MNRQSIRRRTAAQAAVWAVEHPERPRLLFAALLTLVAAVALGAVAARGQPLAALQGASGFVYTADEHGNSLSAVDLAAGRVQTLPVAISPHNVQATADGRLILAVGDPATGDDGEGHDDAGHAGEVEGQLLVFDSRNLGAGPLASVAVGEHPAHVVADRSGRRAFVALAGDDAVAVVGLAQFKLERTIAVGRYPHGLRLSPDGRFIYVANRGTETDPADTVSAIDVATGAVIDTIRTGAGAHGVAVSADGRYVFVTNIAADTVSVIDAATRSVVDTIPVGRAPNGITFRAGDG